MPFTPSILAEKSNNFLKNDKNIHSPYMTIGFDTKPLANLSIKAVCIQQIIAPDHNLLKNLQSTILGFDK